MMLLSAYGSLGVSGFLPQHWSDGTESEADPARGRGFGGPSTPDGVPNEFDCAWREYAYEFGMKIKPTADRHKLFDALMLTTLCNRTAPTVGAVPPAHEYITAANAIFVAVDGDDANPGTSATKPKRTISSGLVATRAMSAPKTLSIAEGTYYPASTVVLTSADSGLDIAGQGAVWISGAQPLPAGLKWQPYRVSPATNGTLSVESGMNNQHGCTVNATANGCTCTHVTTLDACVAACAAAGPAACGSYAWSDAQQRGWASQCCVKGAGSWAPQSQSGHTSGHWRGSAPAANIWKTKLSSAAAKAMEGSSQLRVALSAASAVVRAPRARHPNADPEVDLFPTGWNVSPEFLPPRPTKTQVEIVGPINNTAMLERGSDDFDTYGG